ncbi:MAG: oxidoreductase [Terrimicrobiaceae bacterium]
MQTVIDKQASQAGNCAPVSPVAYLRKGNPISQTLRVGVVGLGRAGTFFHCRPIREHTRFDLVAVSDLRPEVSGHLAREYGCRHHDKPADLFKDPEIDLAVLAVPTRDHAALAHEAIARGIPILIEKPFASSSFEARRIFEAGEQAGVPVFAYHNRRFDPDVLLLKNIIDSGVLGEIVKVSIHLHSYTRRRDWQTLRSMGGGALANWGAHAIDWCFHLFGPDLVLDWAFLYQVLNPGDAEDAFLLGLSHGKTSIQIEYLNCAARSLPKWHVVGRCGTVVSDGQKFIVHHCDPTRLTPIETDDSTASDGSYGIKEDLGWTEQILDWEHWDNCPRFLDALHAHIAHGEPAPINPEDVIAQIRLMEEIRAHAEIRNLQRNPTQPASR